MECDEPGAWEPKGRSVTPGADPVTRAKPGWCWPQREKDRVR